MLLCATQPQLCSSRAKSHQSGAPTDAEPLHLTVVLFTGSSVPAAIGAKLCFLGMPHLQSSLWGSADFLPTCHAGWQGKQAEVCWQLCTWHSEAKHRQAPWSLLIPVLSCIFLLESRPYPSPQPLQLEPAVTQHCSLPQPRCHRHMQTDLVAM